MTAARTPVADRLLPRPLRAEDRPGEFVLDERTVVVADVAGAPIASWLRAQLAAATGLPVAGAPEAVDPVTTDGGGVRAIALAVDAALAAEEYRLAVEPTGVRIQGGSAAAVSHGAQSFLQLLPPAVYRRGVVPGTRWAAPACIVEDSPAFAWRGLMLDVARHFLPKHDVLRFVDLLAMHRMSVLHLHLTDDQGWRMEIRRYPRLTEIGAWRRESQVGFGPDAPADGRPHGGCYTQDDLREIVAYAAARGITVIPEIESPGHVQAAIAAYPELGVAGGDEPREVWTRYGISRNVLNLEESTVAFFRNVLDEVVDVFPSEYIGIGGDECRKDQWRADPRTQERLREIGAATEEEGQSWFVRRIDEHLTSRGRRSYGWDEILEGGLAPGATVASWRGETGAVAAARQGHDVVLCPDRVLYFNYRQSDSPEEPIPLVTVTTVRDVFELDPVPAELTDDQRARVLGAQANVWTEYIDQPRGLDYFAFPRLAALAEALWSADRSGERSWEEFAPRLDAHLARLDAAGVEYRRADGPLPWQQRPGIPGAPRDRADREAELADLTATIVS
ncbi:beta-N-acetylhexosaminidase [Leifsonia sp. ZF2019]|uniref:beta-N-acetylhexosaminidase n=1 Tax=Leifsonia sp. ZF2019 TaxID=2781978 RepID=UPI001CBEFFEF|nr:beta-N-acetylhexosaminidase [Leifsonia sp. ZF2019]UAJ79734.1 beta-N-acetylhexosaminidase [Leifsonia sp. ZF2019]